METENKSFSVKQSSKTKHAFFDDQVKRFIKDFPCRSELDKCKEIEQLASQGNVIYNFGLVVSPFPPEPSIVNGLRESAHHTAYAPLTGKQAETLFLHYFLCYLIN